MEISTSALSKTLNTYSRPASRSVNASNIGQQLICLFQEDPAPISWSSPCSVCDRAPLILRTCISRSSCHNHRPVAADSALTTSMWLQVYPERSLYFVIVKIPPRLLWRLASHACAVLLVPLWSLLVRVGCQHGAQRQAHFVDCERR